MKGAVPDGSNVAIFVQLNDFYHIDYAADPVDPSTRILPRIATILHRLRRGFGARRVYFSLPGDFLNPACLSRAHRGRQMIDMLNRLKLNMAVFGNHEFDFYPDDFTVNDLHWRLKQSKFWWLASNLLPPSAGGGDFFKTHNITDAITVPVSGQHSIEIFGLLYESSYAGFGEFGDPIARTRGLIQQTKNRIIDQRGVYQPARTTFVALTHQSLEDDIRLAQEVPELRLIMGGHDHEVLEKVPAGNQATLIVKTKSNARTLRLNLVAWISKEGFRRMERQYGSLERMHTEHLSPAILIPFLNVALTGHVHVPASVDQSDPDIVDFIETAYGSTAPDRPGVYLHAYNDDGAVLIVSVLLDTMHPGFRKLVELDVDINKRISRWLEKSPEHSQHLLHSPLRLETNDDASRSRSTNFGNFVADLTRGRAKYRQPDRIEADIGLVNGGSFRLGRDIAAGEPISAGVLCDLLFHHNDIRLFHIPGSAIAQVIERSYREVRGQGDFLQISGLAIVDDDAGNLTCSVVDGDGNTRPLDPARTYAVATTTYVATRAYGTIFAPAGTGAQIEPSVRQALEQEIAAQAPNLRVDATPRWRLQPRENLTR